MELRGVEGNYPEVVLGVTALVHGTASRVRRDGLAVEPDARVRTFEVEGDRLFVPGFPYLDGNLSYAAATEGVGNPGVFAYLDSVFEFAVSGDQESEYLVGLRSPEGLYETPESRILRDLPLTTRISREEGLRLVRAACDEFEEQVSSLRRETLGELLPGELERETERA